MWACSCFGASSAASRADQWLVAAAYFEDNFEPLDAAS
jgi:hypothetical protein